MKPLSPLQCKYSSARDSFNKMRIRNRIIYLHWIKMDPDPDHEFFFYIYWIFKQVRIFKLLFFLFSLICMLKLNEPFRDQEISIISFFSTVQIWGFRVNFFFFAVFGLYFVPWIKIRGSHNFADPETGTKILRIQQIRILNTEIQGVK